jgi:hypothetical protein
MATLPFPTTQPSRTTKFILYLHLLRMHNPRILRKALRPTTAKQLLRRHHPIQHLIIINRTRPNHPNIRLGLRFDPHDAAALLARVGYHGVSRVGGAGEGLVRAGEEIELQTGKTGIVSPGLVRSGLGLRYGGDDCTDLIAHHDGESVAIVARRLSAPAAMAYSLDSRRRWC